MPLGRINLASRSLGASVLFANDESFGEKENLVLDSPCNFVPGHFGNKGEIVDGWETRRRGEPGEDWVIVKLGAPGIIAQIDVDTTSFAGNSPERCRIEACGLEGYPSPAEVTAAKWETVLDWSGLVGDHHNVFEVDSSTRYTHVRLVISTDGGVARLRLFGRVVLDPVAVDGLTVDLAGRAYGGSVESSSDNFYSDATSLNHPSPALNMGDGWETKRRRGSGHDWAVVHLGARGLVRVIEVDTSYYVCNASKRFALFVATSEHVADHDAREWHELIAETRLQPDTKHRYSIADEAASCVRIDLFPDGGLARLRVLGEVRGDARRMLGRSWFNSLPVAQAVDALVSRCDLSSDDAEALTGARPIEYGSLVSAPASVRTLIEGPELGPGPVQTQNRE